MTEDSTQWAEPKVPRLLILDDAGQPSEFNARLIFADAMRDRAITRAEMIEPEGAK